MSMQEMAGVLSSRETCGGRRVLMTNLMLPLALEQTGKGMRFREER
jgi:hypothetical protein